MALALPALLCFGLSVDSAAQRQPGVLPRPVLWAEPRPVVPRGRPVTLWCEGDPEAQEYRVQGEDGNVRWSSRSPDKPGSRAAFFIPSMTEGEAGRYQCIYLSPAGWSDYSEPMCLEVTESSGDSRPPPPTTMPTAGLGSHLKILTGVSVAFFLLLVLLLLLLLWHWRRSKGRAAGTAESVSGDRGLGSSSPAAAVQEEILFAASKDTEPKDGAELDGKVAAPKDSQDVTYAQLCPEALAEGTAAVSPSLGRHPVEPSLYATVAVESQRH